MRKSALKKLMMIAVAMVMIIGSNVAVSQTKEELEEFKERGFQAVLSSCVTFSVENETVNDTY